jgi:hypothetical protein
MYRRVLPLVIAAISLATPAFAQSSAQPLADAEVQAVLNSQGSDGLHLREGFNLLASGFVVDIWTPETWIRHQAAVAAKEMRPFGLQDVTPEMRERVWRVEVAPSTPDKITEPQNGSSVSHVVFRTKDKSIVVQPLTKEPTTDTVQNAMGAALSYQGMSLTFPDADVRELWGPKQDKQFWITVIGDNETYDFEIKKKHFERLK